MKRIVIVQNQLAHYRIPLYQDLASDYELTVLHSGANVEREDLLFKQKIVAANRLGPFFWQRNVAEHVSTGDYDVVILMFDVRWLSSLRLLCRLRRQRVVLWGHRYGSNHVINYVRERLMRQVDAMLLYTSADIGRIVASGVDKQRIFVAPNTIHVPNASNTSNAPKNRFLFVGRAQERKKVDELIRAFAQIAPQIPSDYSVTVVGAGSVNKKLQQLAADLGVEDRVHFKGKITNPEDLKTEFASAIAYVSPGAVGLSVPHAFAYGVPVVTGQFEYHGPEADYLNSSNSVLYSPNQNLASILLNLVENPQTAQALGNAAFQTWSDGLSMSVMAAGFRQAIEGNST